MKLKISTAEHAEAAERFLLKDQEKGSFHEYCILSASSQISAVWGSFFLLGIQSRSYAHEDKRMTKEETESAEIFL
jgi:hypothetical protein